MKKIILALLLLVPYSFVSAHARNGLEGFDINTVSVCKDSTAECQLQNAQLRVLVQALLAQVAERLAEQGLQDIELLESSDNDNNVEWYLDADYLAELQEAPLENGKRKAFRVRNGEVVGLDEDSHAVYQELWRIFSTITPEHHLKEFDKYTLYYKKNDPKAAYVEQSIQSRNGRDSEEWELSVNLYYLDFSSDGDYNAIVRLMAHEAGHVFALNEEQVDFFVDEEDCDNYYLDDFESCSKDDSYYTAFTEDFWDEEYFDWAERYASVSRRDDVQAAFELREFYDDHYYDFVTQYAATSPDEDIAESIMFFLAADIPIGELEVYEEKIAIFYNYEEMIEIRKRTQELLR